MQDINTHIRAEHRHLVHEFEHDNEREVTTVVFTTEGESSLGCAEARIAFEGTSYAVSFRDLDGKYREAAFEPGSLEDGRRGVEWARGNPAEAVIAGVKLAWCMAADDEGTVVLLNNNAYAVW